MRLLVLGDCNDRTWVAAALSEINARRGPVALLLHGTETAVDRWACRWALRARVPCATRHHQRVLTMDRPDLLLVFPGGRGTASMVRLARAADIHVETA